MDLSTLYLFGYNAVQFGGWLAIFFRALFSCCKPHVVHQSTFLLLAVFQTMALLEVIHSALGLVKSPVMTTLTQIASRIVITWGIAYAVRETWQSYSLVLYVFAWSITEVIRYSYYALNLFDAVPYALKWCRYTFFIILYPVGVTGELLAVLAAIGPIREREILYYKMPNSLNVSFNYFYMLVLFMLMYIPVFPQLYCYMLGQRRKIIGEAGIGKKQA